MANVSSFNKIPNKLLRPSNISLFTSLGLHVLFLAYVLPNFSFSRRDEQTEINVGLTELTPAEQARLPDLSSTPLDPLSLPDRSALNTPLPDLSSLDLPSSTELVPPPLLPESNIPPVSSIYPPLPTPPLPPPPQIILPPPRQIPLPELNPIPPSDSIAESPTPPSTPAAPPPKVQEPPQPEAPPRLPPLQPYATLPVLPGSKRPPLPFPPPSPSEGARDLVNQPGANNAAPPSPPPTEERQAAANSDAAPPTAPPLPAPNPVEEQRQQQLVAEILERREQLQAEKTETTNEEARKNFLSWSSAVEAGLTPEELSLSGTYPKDACIKKLEGTSVYGILIDAQGKVTNRELIKSSGYPLFNERALETIKTSSFTNKTGNSKPYLVRVNFDYNPEVCPSLSLTPPEPDSPQEQVAPPAPVAAPDAPPSEAAAEKPQPSPAPSAAESKPAQTPVAPPSGAAAEKPQPSSAPAARPQPSPLPETGDPSSPSESLGGPIEGNNPFTQPTPDNLGESEAESERSP